VGGDFHQLNCRMIASLDTVLFGYFDVLQAYRARVRTVGRTEKLPRREKRRSEIHRSAVRPVLVEPDVEVEESCFVAGEPAGLESECSSFCGPVCPVLRHVETATLSSMLVLLYYARSNLVGIGEYSQGYDHCIPKGNVSFVTKVFPRQPGYVIMIWPDASVADKTASSSVRRSMLGSLLPSAFRVSK